MTRIPAFYAYEAESNRILMYLFGDKAKLLPPNKLPADPNPSFLQKRNQNNNQERKN